MEPKGLLSSSQGPTTGPYLKPDESIQHLKPHPFKIYFNIILPYMPTSSRWPLLVRFPNQNFVSISNPSQAQYISRPFWWALILNMTKVSFSLLSANVNVMCHHMIFDEFFKIIFRKVIKRPSDEIRRDTQPSRTPETSSPCLYELL